MIDIGPTRTIRGGATSWQAACSGRWRCLPVDGILASVGISPAELTAALYAATALWMTPRMPVRPRPGAAAGDASVRLVNYDPRWPQDFAQEAARVRAVLGAHALAVEHVGSTAVPGLSAKPTIDMLVVVADSAAEDSYVPPLQAAGYPLRIREPSWHQHRLFNGSDRQINLHVFSVDSPEIDRLLRFRDQLRRSPADRDLYATTKRQLASRQWKDVQSYADAKSHGIETILARAQPVSQ